MVSGHYALLRPFCVPADPLPPLKVPVTFVQLIQRRSPFAMRHSPHQLISGRGKPRTKVPLATVRGHRAPREDGTILYRGVFQPCWIPITHPTLELESVRVHFVSFGEIPLISPS